jgi:hypothetical protein
MAAVAQMVAGASSTGGLTALIVKAVRATGRATQNNHINQTTKITGGDHESSTRRVQN